MQPSDTVTTRSWQRDAALCLNWLLGRCARAIEKRNTGLNIGSGIPEGRDLFQDMQSLPGLRDRRSSAESAPELTRLAATGRTVLAAGSTVPGMLVM